MVGDTSLRQSIGDVLERDRKETDDTLRVEREHVDTRVAEAIERKFDTTIGDRFRTNADEPSATRVLPEVAETLVEAADNLAGAAEGLTRAAQKLTSASDPGIVETLHEVAANLDATADKVTGEDTTPRIVTRPPRTEETGPLVAGKLAEVAESLGAVAATLAEERIEVDDTLRQERQRLDQTIAEEREAIGEAVADELVAQKRLIDTERRETDSNLQRERADTDRAFIQTFDLLQDEQTAHGAARDMMVTREEFLAIVSHDLRTPLSVITVNAAIIAERGAAEGTPPDMIRAVERIQRSADQMGRMLSDLLDATRFEHGQFRLSPRTADVVGSLKECAAAFDALACSHGVTLRLEVPPAPVQARFDRDRILQVLSNLLRNALQFTGSGGVITLRVVQQSPGCQIDVSDTGSGIGPDDLERIFNRFHQAADAPRRGLGLGLYISRAIVQAHGGTIWATSDVGNGSTFSFTLPG